MTFFNTNCNQDLISNDCLTELSFYNRYPLNQIQSYSEDIFNLINIEEMLKKNNNEHLSVLEDNILNQNKKKITDKSISGLNKTNHKTNHKTSKIIKNGSIFQISKESKNVKKGRKKIGNIGGKHNKFSRDNMIRKIKAKIMSAIVSYINSNLKDIFLENELYSKILLQKIDQKYIRDTSVKFNIRLMDLKIKDIFSDRVSTKYLILGKNFNKKLIKRLIKSENQKYNIGILEMTFLQCLDHVSGKKYYEKLKGLEEEFKNVVNNMKETDKYIEAFYKTLNIFEFHYKNITPRRKKSQQ
jgi:hypothetical protein